MNLLREAIEKCDAENASISGEIAKLAIKAKSVIATKAEYMEELQRLCKHPKTKRVDGSYLSGGYDHVSEEHFTIECVECGKVLESKCIRGSYA